MQRIGVGLIGTGFMGKTHALAWRNVRAVLGQAIGAVAIPELAVLCDTPLALLRFASGAQGSMVISRSAWGRKSRLGFEVHGTAGMIVFDQERMNELQLYQNAGSKAEQGFKTILTGPAHPPYGEFCPAPGHQLGFNDLKVIECGDLLRAIAGLAPACPDFSDALEFERVIHAIAASAADGGRRVTL